MGKDTRFIGLDVHDETIAVAVAAPTPARTPAGQVLHASFDGRVSANRRRIGN
jgi:hypothetical protein